MKKKTLFSIEYGSLNGPKKSHVVGDDADDALARLGKTVEGFKLISINPLFEVLV